MNGKMFSKIAKTIPFNQKKYDEKYLRRYAECDDNNKISRGL